MPNHRNPRVPRLFFLTLFKLFRTEMRAKYENVRPFLLRFLAWIRLLYTFCIKKCFPGGVQDHFCKTEWFCCIETPFDDYEHEMTPGKHTSFTKCLTETLLFNFAEDASHKDILQQFSPFWQFEITLWIRDQSRPHRLSYCAITTLFLITESCFSKPMRILVRIQQFWKKSQFLCK